MTLWSLKTCDRIVIRLKTIKYKENFFCYLFSYFILQILVFRPYIFRFSFLTKYICSSLRSQICPNNLNYTPFPKFFVSHLILKPLSNIKVTNFSCYYITVIGAIQSPKSRIYCLQQIMYLTTRIVVLWPQSFIQIKDATLPHRKPST